MRIPLFLKPDDTSEAADLARIDLFQRAFALTGGRGSRQPSPRIEAIAARHFAE